MKKLSALFLSLTFLFISAPHSFGDVTVTKLTSKPHQLFDGTFRNDDLTNDLLPTGRLGKPLESKPKGARTWVIDGALLDEVAAMAAGYELSNGELTTGQLVAKSWISRLILLTAGDKVFALPYGNPDLSLATRSAPSELRLYKSYGIERVEFHLNRKVSAGDSSAWSTGQSRLSPVLRKKYTENRQALTALSSVINAPEVKAQRAKLAVLLSPALNQKDREFFSYNATDGVVETLNRLRISSGKYQIASETGKVPVTVTNDFNVPVKVGVELTPLNSRVQVPDVATFTIGANSRTQLSIPFNAIAPGATTVLAQITNSDGDEIGPASRLAIRVTFFDSRVTYFTIGAALLLFVAALTQTIRRIRRGRNEKQ
jgi:hypothetical protein